jgi:transposase-like protein
MPRPRSTYTAAFKFSAVKMITEQKLSVAEAARRLVLQPRPPSFLSGVVVPG